MCKKLRRDAQTSAGPSALYSRQWKKSQWTVTEFWCYKRAYFLHYVLSSQNTCKGKCSCMVTELSTMLLNHLMHSVLFFK